MIRESNRTIIDDSRIVQFSTRHDNTQNHIFGCKLMNLNNVSSISFFKSNDVIVDLDSESLTDHIDHIPSSSIVNSNFQIVNSTLTEIKNKIENFKPDQSNQLTLTTYTHEWRIKLTTSHSTTSNSISSNDLSNDLVTITTDECILSTEFNHNPNPVLKIVVLDSYTHSSINVPSIVTFEDENSLVKSYPVEILECNCFNRFNHIYGPSLIYFQSTSGIELIQHLNENNIEYNSSVLDKPLNEYNMRFNQNEFCYNAILHPGESTEYGDRDPTSEFNPTTLEIDMNKYPSSDFPSKFYGMIGKGSNVLGRIVEEDEFYDSSNPLTIESVQSNYKFINDPMINFNRLTLINSVLVTPTSIDTDHVFTSNHYNEQNGISKGNQIHNPLISSGIILNSGHKSIDTISLIKSNSILNSGSILTCDPNDQDVNGKSEFDCFNLKFMNNFLTESNVDLRKTFYQDHIKCIVSNNIYMLIKPCQLICDYKVVNQLSNNSSLKSSVISNGSQLLTGSILCNGVVYTCDFKKKRLINCDQCIHLDHYQSDGIDTITSTIDLSLIDQQSVGVTIDTIRHSMFGLVKFKPEPNPFNITINSTYEYQLSPNVSELSFPIPEDDFFDLDHEILEFSVIDVCNPLSHPLMMSNEWPNNKFTMQRIELVDTNLVNGVLYSSPSIHPEDYDVPFQTRILCPTQSDTIVKSVPSVLMTGSIINTGSIVNGVRYESKVTLDNPIFISSTSLLTLGSKVSSGSMINFKSVLNDVCDCCGSNTTLNQMEVVNCKTQSQKIIEQDLPIQIKMLTVNPDGTPSKQSKYVAESPLLETLYLPRSNGFIIKRGSNLVKTDVMSLKLRYVIPNFSNHSPQSQSTVTQSKFNTLTIDSKQFKTSIENPVRLIDYTDESTSLTRSYLILNNQHHIDLDSILTNSESVIQINSGMVDEQLQSIPYQFGFIKLSMRMSELLNREVENRIVGSTINQSKDKLSIDSRQLSTGITKNIIDIGIQTQIQNMMSCNLDYTFEPVNVNGFNQDSTLIESI